MSSRSSRTVALVLFASLALVIAGGCSKKKSESTSTTSVPATTVVPTTALPSTSSSSTSTSEPTSTSTTSTSTPATPTTLPTTPEGFAQALLEAWQQGNRTAAAAVASPEAVDQIFAHSPGAYTLEECSGAAGSIICTYSGASGGLTIQVRNITGGEPMLVVGVQFS